ncbi:hypothetical protein TcWFU_004460 [Taenia crassiceps]|uniref:Uncharacterized protein n=1 Tax=Taenia crassiceps TaxID=6207 RepID=A0ABR4Q788_9CEST
MSSLLFRSALAGMSRGNREGSKKGGDGKASKLRYYLPQRRSDLAVFGQSLMLIRRGIMINAWPVLAVALTSLSDGHDIRKDTVSQLDDCQFFDPPTVHHE